MDVTKIRAHFKATTVKQLADPAVHFDILHEEKTVEEVQSKDVCTELCTDPELNDMVNAWRYNFVSRMCICAWLKPSVCESDDFVPVNQIEENPKDLVAYIQSSKTLLCGKGLRNIKSIWSITAQPHISWPMGRLSEMGCNN